MKKQELIKVFKEYGLLEQDIEIWGLELVNRFQRKNIKFKEYKVYDSAYDYDIITIIVCENVSELQQIKYKLMHKQTYLVYVKSKNYWTCIN